MSEKKVKAKKKKLLSIATATLTAAGLLVGTAVTTKTLRTAAYLTDSDSATNVFTIGKIDIEGKEPNWPTEDKDKDGVPDVTEDFVPNQEVKKDPQITNVDKDNDAIVFIRVSVPRVNLTEVADNGALVDKNADGTPKTKSHDIFFFKNAKAAASDHKNSFNAVASSVAVTDQNKDETRRVRDGKTYAGGDIANSHAAGNWIELGKDEVSNADYSTYLFGYSVALKPGETTDTLFDKVQLINHIEGQITDGVKKDIVVNYYAIQSTDILENSVDLAKTLDETNLTKIYDIYLNQNLETINTGVDRKSNNTANRGLRTWSTPIDGDQITYDEDPKQPTVGEDKVTVKE